MKPKFNFYEVVLITAEPPRVRKTLVNKEGIVVGMSDPNESGSRDYGVHVNEYGETFGLSENALISTGRIASPQDVVSCSRWKTMGRD